MSNCLTASLEGESWCSGAHISWIMRRVSELCSLCFLGQKFYISRFIGADQWHGDNLSWLSTLFPPLNCHLSVVQLIQQRLYLCETKSWSSRILTMSLYLYFRVKRCFVAEIHLWLTVLSLYNHNACVILLNFIESIWSSVYKPWEVLQYFHPRNTQ